MPADGDPPIVVFDLDGVVADVRHRLHHLEHRPRRWDAFFTAAIDDPPLAEGVTLANLAAQDARVVYLTGRPEWCRRDTLSWLRRHQLPAGELHMRGNLDRRPARLLKPEILRRLARAAPIALVVDDDAEVCAAVEAAGFPVRRADWMAGAPALLEAQEREGRT